MIFAGLKLAAGTSLLLLVAAEMIVAQNGIGSMVLHDGNVVITTETYGRCVSLALAWLNF